MHPINSTSHHSSLSYNPSTEDWHFLTIVLTSLLVTAFLLSFFSICLCHYIMKYIARPHPPASIPRGLPPAIISSFPTLGYSSVKDPFLVNDGLDCAVCLEDFSDDDVLRLLTGCSHVFHPECIHLWLLTHTTCPVCRRNLDGDQKSLEVGIPMMETGRRDVDARRHEESQHYRNSLREEEVREGVDQADGREQVMVVMEQ